MSEDPEDEPSDALRVLIADDELMARKRLARLLAGMRGVVVVAECTDGDEAIERIDSGDVDVAFLDIRMPRMSGLDSLGLIGEGGPVVVFTTAHADHAIAAFDGGAVDYLLKPVDAARLVKAVDRARARLAPARPELPQGVPARFPIPTRKGVVLVDVSDISHAFIDGESVVVCTRVGPFFTDFRLSELERRLPADRFVRVHRKAIVNLARVQRLEDNEAGGYVAHLDDGSTIAVSRQAARRLRRRWELPR